MLAASRSTSLFATVLKYTPTRSASAATIKVTTKKDEFGTGPKKCSLREAVQAANTDKKFGGCPRGKGRDVIVLGRGVRLWDGLEGLQDGYDVEAVSSPSGVTHVTFTRRPGA